MESNNIYSNVCMNDLKEIIRVCISNSNLKVNCDEILSCIHEEIDPDKFSSWLSFNLDNFKSKTNQASYFKKSFLNELDKGTFKLVKIHYLPNIQPLINEMRERNMMILAEDTAYLYVMFDYLLNAKKIDINIISLLNRKVLSYMSDDQTFADYKKLLKSANTLKPYNIEWELIDKQTTEFNEQWNLMLDKLESVYD